MQEGESTERTFNEKYGSNSALFVKCDVTKENDFKGKYGSNGSFSYCTLSSVDRVFWPSDRVVDCNILILSRPSKTGTLLLTTQILRPATKWCASLQIINTNMQNFLFLHLPQLMTYIAHSLVCEHISDT